MVHYNHTRHYTDRFHCTSTLGHSSYRKVILQQFNQFLPVFFIVVNSVITFLMTIYFNPCHIMWNIKWHCEQNGNRHIYSISSKEDTKMNKWLQLWARTHAHSHSLSLSLHLSAHQVWMLHLCTWTSVFNWLIKCTCTAPSSIKLHNTEKINQYKYELNDYSVQSEHN